jgi:hypothetical protein
MFVRQMMISLIKRWIQLFGLAFIPHEIRQRWSTCARTGGKVVNEKSLPKAGFWSK